MKRLSYFVLSEDACHATRTWLPFVNRVFVGSPLFCVDSIHLQDLTKHLDEVTQNSEIVEIRQKEAECELEAARDRVQQQATEILLKASKLSSPLCCLLCKHIQ